jgi:hypothetical protein
MAGEEPSDAEIADFRSTWESYARDRFTTYRLKPAGTGDGFRPKGSRKYPDDYAVNLTDEICRFMATMRSRTEQQGAGQGQVRAKGDWTIEARYDADITDEDIVVITTRNNREFDLVGRGGGTSTDDIKQVWEANEMN